MNKIIKGNCLTELKKLDDNSVNCCVTSPPYWGLRDYDNKDQLGLEKTPEEYVGKLVEIFNEVKRVLKNDGTLWLNLGDSYMGASSEHKDEGSFGKHSCISKGTQSGVPTNGRAERNKNLKMAGYKPKDLVGIPWMVAFALRADGWYLRQDIIWHKPNPMPESVTDRCTKSHEYIFLMSKSKKYYYDHEAIKTPLMANKRSVWTVATKPFTSNLQTFHWVRAEQDVLSDGNLHIMSVNCPNYGGLFDLVSSILNDEHEGDLLTHILNTYNYLSLEPKDGFCPFGTIHDWKIGEQSLDSFLRSYLFSANSHNNGNNKTDLYLSTNFSCTPSSERLSRIERILTQHGLFVINHDNDGNNTLLDDFPCDPKPKTIYYIVGKLKLEAASYGQRYEKITKKNEHFATFPQELIVDCIKAGCPEGGIVLDPFSGAGTTPVVARKLNRNYLAIELNGSYIKIANERLNKELGIFI